MKSPKPPAPTPIAPPVRSGGSEVADKRKQQLKDEKKKKGMRSTVLHDTPALPTLGNRQQLG